jgi:hypothetical protein
MHYQYFHQHDVYILPVFIYLFRQRLEPSPSDGISEEHDVTDNWHEMKLTIHGEGSNYKENTILSRDISCEFNYMHLLAATRSYGAVHQRRPRNDTRERDPHTV